MHVSRADGDALARLAGAVALAELDGERAPQGLEDTLVRALVNPDPAVERAYLKGLGDYTGALLDALLKIGQRGVTTGLRAFEHALVEQCAETPERLPQGEEDEIELWRPGPDGRAVWHTLRGRTIYPHAQTHNLADALLRLTLGRPNETEHAMAALTTAQRQALALVLDCDAAWHYDLDMQEMLFSYNLPYTREGLRDALRTSQG